MNEKFLEWRKKTVIQRIKEGKHHNTTEYQRKILDLPDNEKYDERKRVA